ncbi:RHS repeat domain-containing protein [Chryseobacterium profundimaris]|uniref:RHS repeat-associated core domain-containing protein n=1 Tax=Chryseobacterium profundimaris TaxID=1387275 RepID=A0ABY1PLC7_9FLAO|nr:RHS repeat-associated core domain-containing protein [Chryseobacterium profundimaris]SMP35238.1 RHS repeat-associated core domain-containing protein [Chryseobacterium profundimaris]
MEEKEIYWFHPDYLGSSSFITGLDGEVTGYTTSDIEKEFGKAPAPMGGLYYLHGDHLGTATYVTNEYAEPTQFFLNLPFGETMVEQQEPTAYVNPYKFNAKELDSETGLYYYGARYYNPRLSIWYGVDPLAVYNPVMETQFYGDGQHNGGVFYWGNLNPYIYCYQNPVIYIDPNGKQIHFSQAPKFNYDSGFSKFPKQKPSGADRTNYALWTAKATMARPLLPNGVAGYMHYLGNTGKDYTFNFAKYLNEDKSGKTLLTNITNLAKNNSEKVLTQPGSISYYSQGFSAGNSLEFPYPESEDCQKAIGAFNFYYKADLSVKSVKSGLKYTLNLTIYAEDKYNFNPGQKDIATDTPDDVNGRFEVIGWAKEFMQRGAAKIKKIEWIVKQKKP